MARAHLEEAIQVRIEAIQGRAALYPDDSTIVGRNAATKEVSRVIKPGSYVLATKYYDGDPGDQYAMGFFEYWYDHFGQNRYIVVDNDGNSFRGNGFRCIASLSHRRGVWLCANIKLIDSLMDSFSIWHWYHAPWSELNEQAKTYRR